MDQDKSLYIANNLEIEKDDEKITVEITKAQYDQFVKMVDIGATSKYSTVQRTSHLLSKLEKVVDTLECDKANINNLTKVINSAKGLLDVIAKLQGEYHNVMNHPIVIEILDQFTTITAVCPTCKQKAYTVIKAFQ